MAEKKDIPRIHIVLDASKTKRCDWCGSPQGEEWSVSEIGIFCSKECSKAFSSSGFDTSVFALFLSIVMFLITLVLPESLFESTPRIFAVIGVSLFIPIMIAITFDDYKSRRYTLEIPKGSRRYKGVSQISLLQRISVPIECPNCDGNINLSSISEDLVYTCQYCGANGIVEIDIRE